MNISEETLHKIEQEKIQPRPVWKFRVQYGILWAAFILITILGILAMSSLLHILAESDWDIHPYLGTSLFSFILMLLPYFWIFLFIFFSVFAFYVFRTTKHGYRYSPYIIMGISLLISISCGAFLFSFGVGEEIHEAFYGNIPLYNTLTYTKEDVWRNPKQGLLSGMVESEGTSSFMLRDFDGDNWTIIIASGTIGIPRTLEKGEELKLVGTWNGDHVFSPIEIRPWHILQKRMK